MKINWSFLKRTSWWTSVAIAVAGVATYASGHLSAKEAAVAVAVAAAAYALSRGLAKFNSDLKAGIFTSEFWTGVAGIATMVLVAIPGHLSASVLGVLSAVVAVAYIVARGFAKSPYAETYVEPTPEEKARLDKFWEDCACEVAKAPPED